MEPKTRIAELRQKAGLTQMELSQKVGVREATIANWESGRSGTDAIAKVIVLCRVLDCSPEDLLRDG